MTVGTRQTSNARRTPSCLFPIYIDRAILSRVSKNTPSNKTPHAYLLPWAQNRFNRFKQKGSGILEAKCINVATEQ